ncbi:MAG: response regulator [bacterium]
MNKPLEERGKLRTMVIDRDPDDLKASRNVLLLTNQVEIVGETGQLTLAPALIDKHTPDFVFISMESEGPLALEMIERIRERHGGLKIVALSAQTDAYKILDCFRAGADEFLVKPMQAAEVNKVIERFKAQLRKLSQDQRPHGKVVAVWGSRGGNGATTVACNLANALQEKQPTILVDFHFAQGDLSVYFNLQPAYTLEDVGQMADRLDETLIDNITLKRPNGLSVLVQPIRTPMVELKDEETVKLLKILQAKYKYVVLDIGHEESMAGKILPYVDKILLILTQNMPSIYLAVRKLRFLRNTGFEKQSIFVTVNAYARRSEVTLGRIAKALEVRDLYSIRHDEANVLTAMNRGFPLQEVSRRGKANQDIAGLAQMIHEQNRGTPHTPPKEQLELKPLMEKTIFPETLRESI